MAREGGSKVRVRNDGVFRCVSDFVSLLVKVKRRWMIRRRFCTRWESCVLDSSEYLTVGVPFKKRNGVHVSNNQ